MAGSRANKWEFNAEILREFLQPIKREDFLAILTQWGLQVEDASLSKTEILIRNVGTALTSGQLEDLWLLREKSLILSTRGWTFFQSDRPLQAAQDPQALQKLCATYLKTHNLEFNNRIYAFRMDTLRYLTLTYRGPSKLVEEEMFQFKVFRPIQRIRILINWEKGLFRIHGHSIQKIQVCLGMLEEVLQVKLKKVPVPSYIINDFVKSEKNITKLVVSTPRIVGGFSGIDKIIIEGPSVVEGLYDLQSRQEIPFSFEGLQKVGPFSFAKTRAVRVSNRGEVQINDDATQERLLKLLKG